MIAFSVIRHDVRRDMGITTLQYLVADTANTLCGASGYCSQDDICESLGISRQVVSRCVTEMLAMDPRLIDLDADGIRPTQAWKTMAYSSGGAKPVETDVMRLTVEVINRFNETCKSSYRAATYVPNIQAIIRRDPSVTLRQFDAVIQHKNIQWKDDDKMREYLRPGTLFGSAGKFLRYLDEARQYWKQREKFNQIN